jgi:tetratricopeptide (TPR) repeat protein
MMVGLIILTVLTVANPQGDDGAPPELDEQQQLEIVVAYDNLHTKLIEWDVDLARDYQARGEEQLAEQKLASARQRADDIVRRYEQFLAEFPDNAVAHNYYGEALADLKDNHAQAAEEWRKAIELDPELADPHNNLGIYYGHFGHPDKAIDELRKAVELDPSVADFHFNLALAYHNFRHVAARKLGWELPRLFEEILSESRKARQLAPDDLEIATDYARTYFSSEDFNVAPDWTAALSAWEYCLPLAKDDAQRFNILLNLGRVALRMDEKEDARRYLDEALSIRPESPVVKRLLEIAQ